MMHETKNMSEERKFLIKLADPDEYDIMIDGLDRTLEYYASTFHNAIWAEVPRKTRNLRTWRILFDVKFGNHLPSLHITDDIKHNFSRTCGTITVSVMSYDIDSDHITVFVSKDMTELSSPIPGGKSIPPFKSKLKPTTLNIARARKNA